jgi:site-specific DNA-methyltransferase (adenine-specific)
MNQITLFNEDCLVAIKNIPDNSVDSIVTDPPYHLTSITKRFGKDGSAPAKFGTDGAFQRASKGFMGKEWDGGDISFRTEIWEECLRVLKPGGHLLAFSSSRTYHRMAVAIEDAGFSIRDQIMWIYGSGFPKSYNLGKAIDKIQGNEREVVGEKEITSGGKTFHGQDYKLHETQMITKGKSAWEGWGTALKPAVEPLVLARKPFKGGVADNVLKFGTGGLNIDGSRVEGIDPANAKRIGKSYKTDKSNLGNSYNLSNEKYKDNITVKVGGNLEGRFPANVIFDEEAGRILDEQSGYSKSNTKQGNIENKGSGVFLKEDGTQATGHKHKVYTNTIQDEGGASRFFYCAKASKKDRNEGLDNFEDKASQMNSGGIGRKISVEKRLETNNENAPTMKNIHPTVKPTKLMEYLVTLVTPTGGIVLDPFMGSGSTGKAAVKKNFSFIGIEREKEYFDIAKARIEHAKGSGLFKPEINQDEL